MNLINPSSTSPSKQSKRKRLLRIGLGVLIPVSYTHLVYKRQGRSHINRSEASGAIIENFRSSTHECVPVRFIMLISVMTMSSGQSNIEVTIGAPLDGMLMGTFVLIRARQDTVVNVNADDHTPLPHVLIPLTLQ